MLLRKESSGRFWRVLVLAIVFGLSIVRVSLLYAQSEDVEKINDKAEKYFKLLSSSPSGDYLYDRFYDAWLDTGTVEGLERFLKANISKSSEYSGHLLLAFFYERQGKDKDALEHFNEASAKEQNPDVLYQKASVETRLSKFDAAISDLLEADKANEDKELSVKISKLLAKLYIRTGKKDSAAEVWEKLIKSNPNDEEIYEDMIELQVSEGLYDQAIETSDQLLKITKDSYKTIMR
jgi:tetratricopeptide (TPR) repeat protein